MLRWAVRPCRLAAAGLALATDAAVNLGQNSVPRCPSALSARRWTRVEALYVLYGVLAVQFVSTVFFVGTLWTEVLGLRTTSIPYVWQEYIEVLASVGLLVGTCTTILFVRNARRREVRLQRQVDVAAGNFQEHLSLQFQEWSLSPSESLVAIFAMKGFSNAEVAELRGTSVATVKSQLNAVYRKSGLENRQQLIAFLGEELLSGVSLPQESGFEPVN